MDFATSWEKFIDKITKGNVYKELLDGLLVTIEVAILGLIIGILIGTIIAIIRVMPKYKVFPRILDKICACYVGIFRGIPMVVQLLIGYFVLDFGSPLFVGITIFGLNSGAYVSEIMRSGINSVDKGQMEAGRAVGLTYAATMLKIVVPQAIKNILPTLGNEFIVLIKETSVLSFITLLDITGSMKVNVCSGSNYIVPYLTLGLLYLVLVFIIAGGIKLLEKRLKKSER